ncbi:hypothetical protein PR202_ga23611 [Eleusine coracana subsp. coracana]|uniref:Uncharacterized protein n=1 Tax=Eleusine coracana subsp. coracana TaxID=191504 RepID=A0AAV5D5L9_ELECO|nr:hypothetical protein PR202_ga23611 [Eleusine coracana subsp. coracana]
MSFRDANMSGATLPSLLGGGFRRGGVSVSSGGGGISDSCLPFSRPVHQRMSPQPPFHYLYPPTPTLHPMSYPRRTRSLLANPPSATTSSATPSPPATHCCFCRRRRHTETASPATELHSPRRRPPVNVQADKINCNCSFACGGHSSNNNMNAST